jgi:hypothetical protein
MVYWFANHPESTARVAYSRQRHERIGEFLRTVVSEIMGQDREGFERTHDLRQCAQCLYRALCGRQGGDGAPRLEGASWLDEDLDLSLDSEEIQELAY